MFVPGGPFSSIPKKVWLVACLCALAVVAGFLWKDCHVTMLCKKDPREILKTMSIQQRTFLRCLCKEILYNSTMGYTLFGDKPISVISDFHRPESVRRYFFLRLSLPFIRKYNSLLNTHNFAVILDQDFSGPCLYLVNKRAFINAVQNNITLFRDVLGKNVTPEQLLSVVIEMKTPFEETLKGSHALFGVLFGYGIENALLFERRYLLEQVQERHAFPPWKEDQGAMPKGIEEFVLVHEQRKIATKKMVAKFQLNDTPLSEGFRSISDELIALNQKVKFLGGAQAPPRVCFPVDLPSFVGDSESKETRELLEKYKFQQLVIRKVLSRDDFLEQIVGKFYESM
jgi:hypothetical protein